MDLEAVLDWLNRLLIAETGQPLSDLQQVIVQQVWQGQKYRTIAHRYGCTEGHVKDVAAELWQVVSAHIGESVSKRNVQTVLPRYLQHLQHDPAQNPTQSLFQDSFQNLLWNLPTVSSQQGSSQADLAQAVQHLGHLQQQDEPSPGPFLSLVSDLSPVDQSVQAKMTANLENLSLDGPGFLGREDSFAYLHQLVKQGHRTIVIQGEGGIGKTTLAQHYLYQTGFELVLELLMAKEPQTITPVEQVVEEWLRQDLGEEPGREFGVSLGRLKRHLNQRSIGILIDNLEPALDHQGRFIAPHAGYRELFRVLSDARVKSVTLITSRDRLCEPGVNVMHYRLPGLSLGAWQQFFNQKIQDFNAQEFDPEVLVAMHQAYGGNAKAMGLLWGTILEDFEGDMVAYWQEYQDHPLSLTDLKNLIVNQVERLLRLDSNAYRVFCRLGCYRYQEIPTVPTLGLTILMWDIDPARHREIITSLRNRSLVESRKGEYWLHPVLRAEAIARLRQDDLQQTTVSIEKIETRTEWEEANRRAARFWSDRITSITTISDAIQALEAYYHFLSIADFEAAGQVLLKSRHNQWGQFLPLSSTLYRMGLIQPVLEAITTVLDRLQFPRFRCELYNILGDLYWITGQIPGAIQCQETTIAMANHSLTELPETSANHHARYSFRMLAIDSHLSIGLYHLDLWDLTTSAQWLRQVIALAENTEHARWAQKATVCLALVEAYLGHDALARTLADRSYQIILQAPSPEYTGRSAYFIQKLGQVYGVLGNIDLAWMLYQQAISFAEESHYIQVKANALKGIAELERTRKNFESAIDYHHRAIGLLEEIGAKCDLADALFQLGVSYLDLINLKLTCSEVIDGDRLNQQPIVEEERLKETAQLRKKCLEVYDRAIQLFHEINAPNQITRVQQLIIRSNLNCKP